MTFMDTLAEVTGSGFAGTLIAYPLMYLALSHRHKASLSNALNLCLFIVTVPLVGAAYVALGYEETSLRGFMVLFGAPLLTSFIVIGATFESRAKRAKAQAAEGSDSTPNPVVAHVCGFSRPLERLGFILLVVGIGALLLGLIGFWTIEGIHWRGLKYDLREPFIERINYRGGWSEWSARLGLVASVLGYLIAYHYERTLGPLLRIVRWMRTGQ